MNQHNPNPEKHNTKTIREWLKLKMKEKFGRDFNLDKEMVITENDQLKVALTPETSSISQSELLELSFLVNSIDGDNIDFQKIEKEISELK